MSVIPAVGVGAAAFAALSLLEGCTHSCTARGCESGADLRVSYPFSATETLAGGTLRVCRNDRCNLDNIIASGAGLALAFPVDTHIRMSAGFYDLELTVHVDPSSVIPLKDGDAYSVELRDRNGVVVASKEWQADYTETYPNGEDCDEEPCRFVDLR
ncbi:MAG: hypothetical protein JNL83_31345 [Myxococcales bacterium]|nr:hypothetical protein [Myxococcales bacterium]